MKIGETIQNGTGAIVLASKEGWREGERVVLCLIPSKKEFVTWWVSPGTKVVTVNGHYFRDIEAAVADYRDRS